MKYWRVRLVFGLSVVLSASGCAPGYMKADELDRKEQGPAHCAARCHDLGMQMGALVLVGNQLPGCVCQPRGVPGPVSRDAASATTAGYTVMLAAAAAAYRQQQQQQQQQQQLNTSK